MGVQGEVDQGELLYRGEEKWNFYSPWERAERDWRRSIKVPAECRPTFSRGINRKTQAGKDCLPKAVTLNAEEKKQGIFSAAEVSCKAGNIQLQPAGCFKIWIKWPFEDFCFQGSHANLLSLEISSENKPHTVSYLAKLYSRCVTILSTLTKRIGSHSPKVKNYKGAESIIGA